MTDTQPNGLGLRVPFAYGLLNLPTFGNFCGPGWSGGEVSTTERMTQEQKDTPPIRIGDRPSPVDALCKAHDLKYDAAVGQPNKSALITQADVELMVGLSRMDWASLTPTERDYATLMAVGFWAKIKASNPQGLDPSDIASAMQKTESALSAGNVSYTDQNGNSASCSRDPDGNITLECKQESGPSSSELQGVKINSDWNVFSQWVESETP